MALSRFRSSVSAFALLGLLTIVASYWVAPGTAYAEDPPAVATDAPPAPVEDSLAVHIAKSIGWFFGIIFIALSCSLVALVILLALDLRMPNAIPPGFVEEFTDTVNQRKFKEAFDMARADPSFLGKVLTGGMSRLQYGIEDARDAAYNMVESIKSSKDQINNYVAVICSIGPLIGLVGTVFGMILSFKELARGGKIDSARLADGISHALVITMFGIGIAVPGLFFNAFFRNRITRIAMDTSNIADDLLTQMYHNSKKPAAPTPPTPTTGGELRPPATTTVPTK